MCNSAVWQNYQKKTILYKIGLQIQYEMTGDSLQRIVLCFILPTKLYIFVIQYTVYIIFFSHFFENNWNNRCGQVILFFYVHRE